MSVATSLILALSYGKNPGFFRGISPSFTHRKCSFRCSHCRHFNDRCRQRADRETLLLLFDSGGIRRSLSRSSDTPICELFARPAVRYIAPNVALDTSQIFFSWSDPTGGDLTVIRVIDISIVPQQTVRATKSFNNFAQDPAVGFKFDSTASTALFPITLINGGLRDLISVQRPEDLKKAQALHGGHSTLSDLMDFRFEEEPRRSRQPKKLRTLQTLYSPQVSDLLARRTHRSPAYLFTGGIP